jgi:uncharacterized protein YbjT (DUF2867 family)
MLEQAGAQLVVANFDSPDSLNAALAGVERCLLLSAVDQRLVEREGRSVEAAKQAGVRHLVKLDQCGRLPLRLTARQQSGLQPSSWPIFTPGADRCFMSAVTGTDS